MSDTCGIACLSIFKECNFISADTRKEIYRKICLAIGTENNNMLVVLTSMLMRMKIQYDEHNAYNLTQTNLFNELSQVYALTNDPEIACQMRSVSECILGEYNTTDDYTKMVQSILDL